MWMLLKQDKIHGNLIKLYYNYLPYLNPLYPFPKGDRQSQNQDKG